MKSNRTHLALALLVSICVPGLACDRGGGAPAAPAVVAQPQPTDARLQQRATERWNKMVAGDWIDAYDFLSPEQKRTQKLADYLVNKSHHKYENPRVWEVLGNDGKTATVRIEVLWTPVDERLKNVKLTAAERAQLTQNVEMYEQWAWSPQSLGSDWGYVRSLRPDEYVAEHPEALHAAQPAGADQAAHAESQPADGAQSPK